jgi:hypothetical protein
MNESEISERFFGFPTAALAAIRKYQDSRDPKLVPEIVHGIVEKYLPPGAHPPPGEIRSLSAFGLESLTLMEVVLDIQDALGLTLTDEELRALSDLNEATGVLEKKVAALSAPASVPNESR